MSFMVPLMLFGWFPLTLLLFQLMAPRRAVLVSMIGGWLFLPVAGYHFSGIPDYSKLVAIGILPFAGAMMFDLGRMIQFRPRWIDIPIAVMCISPFFTSLSNGLGAYDGMSSMVECIMLYGMPWILGRVYFADSEGIRDLAVAIFVGGLIYIPFCVWEARMSPNLHAIVYGYQQTKTIMDHRLGGYRPKVFMQHGIMLGLWMAVASAVGVVLWRSRARRQVFGLPIAYLSCVLVATLAVCRSFNGYIEFTSSLGSLYAATLLRWKWVLVLVILLPAIYVGDRTTSNFIAPRMLHVASMVSTARAASLNTRITQEDRMLAHCFDRPLLGWGGWGRNRVNGGKGDRAITDSFWIIEFSKFGFIGLIGFGLVLLLPPLLLMIRVPIEHLFHPAFGPAVALALLSWCVAVDCTINAMVGAPYFTAMAAVAGFASLVKTRSPVGRVAATRHAAHRPRSSHAAGRTGLSIGRGMRNG